jgi:MFS family permease
MNLRSIVPDRISTPAKYFLFADVLNGFGNGTFGVVIQLYLMTLGFESSALGSMFMMNSIGIVLLTLPAGILADRYSKGKIMIFGFVAIGLALLLILTVTSIEMLSLAWLLLGLGNATTTVFGPIYSSFFDAEDMDRAFGLEGFLNIMALSMGSLMGFVPPILVDRYGFSLQSSYWILLAIGTGFLFVQMPFYLMSSRGVTQPRGQQGFKFNLRSKGVVAKFSFIYIISTIGFGVFFSLFPYYVNKKFGVESDALGSLFFASNFVNAVANAVAPRISKKLGTLRTIAVTIGLCTPFYFMIPLAPNFTWLSAAYIIRLFLGSLSNPLVGSFFYKLLYDEEKATANSIIRMVNNGANILAPKLGGQLMEQVSLEAPAFLGAGLYPLVAASYYLLLRNEKEKKAWVEAKEAV